MNLEVIEGQFLILVGPTGSGKSTLGMCLNGLIPHVLRGQFMGHVVVDGADTRQTSVAELSTRVGLLFQDPEAQICNLYGYDELAFGCENLGLPPEEIQRRIAWAAEVLGLAPFLTTPVQELSLGLKQRIALASVLAMKPQILVLDEPTSNLDAYTVRSLVATLKELKRMSDITILVIEHDADSFVEVADRVIVIDNGRIVIQGPLNKVYLDPIQNLPIMSIKVPELYGLINEIRKTHNTKAYRGNITVAGVSEYIASQCRSATALQITEKEENTLHEEDKRVPIVTIERLSIELPDGRKLLQDINVAFHPGETVAVVGANGAGKTVLFKTIAGLRVPRTGTVKLNGVDILSMKTLERARQIGFVFQEPDHQFIKDRVFEDMELAWRSLSNSSEEAAYKANESLAHLNLSNQRESYMYQLSMGQRRMISIATALTPGKKLLILDEPTTGLDSESTHRIIEMLYRVKNDSLATIIITHDMKVASSLADRAVALAKGSILYDGPLLKLLEQPQLLHSIKVFPPVVWQVYESLRSTWGLSLQPALTNSQLVNQLERGS